MSAEGRSRPTASTVACDRSVVGGRLSRLVSVTRLRFSRLRLTFQRVPELSETRTGQLRLWLCLLGGLVEFYVDAARSDRIRRIRVGHGNKARTLYLRGNGVDVYTFYATFIKGIYDAALPLPRGAVIVDLGANIGLTAAYWALVCEDARVVAVEPESSNVGLLQMNVSPADVSIHHAAIAERCGTASLEIRGATGHTVVADETEQGSDSQTIQMITPDFLEAIEELRHVDLIKADIEGAEAGVFTRPWKLLQKCETIIMEIHQASVRADIVRLLAHEGFSHLPGERVDFPDVFRRDQNDGTTESGCGDRTHETR